MLGGAKSFGEQSEAQSSRGRELRRCVVKFKRRAVAHASYGPSPKRRQFGQSAKLTTLRVVLFLHALAVLTQAVFAGQFLSGVDAQVVFHERLAWVIFALAIVQIGVSAALLRAGAPLWLLVASIFVLIAEGLQLGTGYGRFLGVHIPLGVFVFGLATWLMLWSFRVKTFEIKKQL